MAALVDKTVLSWFMLVTIFVTFQMMNGVESGFIPKVEVGIMNILPVELGFHCKDKTRDDGFHTLPPNQTYHFGFKIDIIFERAQWFCQFTWYRFRQVVPFVIHGMTNNNMNFKEERSFSFLTLLVNNNHLFLDLEPLNSQ
ncbi:putative plant self-incompatibility S1 [Lupinus albus]|uniref:S-protein homolog n=1 Tax=Lupinus albus TaxID=3870 RepID=A0A6A4QFY3_LUPAL|nr:putative plant self-incompatibility S1 [Lupinus albus]